MSIDATHYYICHTIPRNNDYRCDIPVNNAVVKLHNKCCKKRHSHKVLGKHLNLLQGIGNAFDAEKHYTVCHRLYYQRLMPIINKKKNDNHTNVDENTDLNEPPPDDVPVADPSPQQSNGNESNVDHNSGLNEPSPIIVPVANPAPQELNEDQNQSDPDQQSTSLPRCGFTTNFPTDTLKACNTDGRRKSYMDLSIRETRRRVIMASKNILASNVCPKTLEKDGMDYLKKI